MSKTLQRKFVAISIVIIVLLSIGLVSAKDYSVTAGNWKINFKSNDTLYTEVQWIEPKDSSTSGYYMVWVKKDPGLTTRCGSFTLFEYNTPVPFGKESLRGWMSLYLSSLNKTPIISDYSIDNTDAVIAEGWNSTFGRTAYAALYPIDINSYGSAQKAVGFLSLLDREINFEILNSLHVEYIPQASQTSTTAKTNNWIYPNGSSHGTEKPVTAGSDIREPYVLIKCQGTTYSKLGPYTEAGVGKVYLVTNLQIENHGYDEFYVNPNYVKVEANNVLYDYSWVSLEDIGLPSLDSVTLMDGGSVTGALAFEIPSNTQRYTLLWRPWGGESYNVKVEYV